MAVYFTTDCDCEPPMFNYQKNKIRIMGKSNRFMTPEILELLKDKGYVENDFDEKGFYKLIIEWFRKHDLKDKLLIRSKRFIEMSYPPSCGYIDMTDTDMWVAELPWEKVIAMSQKGEIKPFIFVDTPFFGNVREVLSSKGFIVSRPKKNTFEVSVV